MIADSTTEQLTWEEAKRAINLTEAAKRLRSRGGRPPNVGTVRRWANKRKGYKPAGYEGEPIVLRTLRVGQDLLTFPEWVEEFARAQVAAGLAAQAPLPPAGRPVRSREAAHRRAEAELDRAGVGTRKGGGGAKR